MKLFFILFLVFLDFLSKKLILNFINTEEIFPFFYFIDIVNVHNKGIAFGLFQGIFPSWFIVMIGVFIIILLLYWMISNSNINEKWGIILILSGAISNIGDRFINGYVLDFIYLHYNAYYWPAFNFADIYISIGVIIIIIENFKIFNTRVIDKND